MKTKSVSSYLNAARAAAHNDYAHADGAFGAGSFTQNAFANATGAAPVQRTPTSQPYLINVTSTSGAAVDNFSILGSFEYLQSGNFVNGNLVVGNVTVSSGMPGITYQSMLAQFQVTPFTVGLTYYQSATANQIQQALSIVKKDANGNQSTRPIVPSVDPYQFQSTVLALPDSYEVDGFTSIVIRSILPNATIGFQLYPAENINVARGLNGPAVSKEFADPGIVKAQTVVLK